ncbi:IS110 family transposase [Sinorhizobium terangae]|uniref:IS110 family transposase n=1 Tax=Sinorhizobium terangae TaxID=110322 RepID=A0A6N7LKG6_SINTE|nr:IS110 family transposase [Sinorhizobium terangae]MBB4188903.1 error-prone DNA polymerase [Sinorhizobium terangae]MQX17846.1 IS110 family transposase [Sinorhizobium terangae]MQX18302.1 IS110 family transposase [Sinorhizobium terangae]MQX19225.1 IS110 family transposase [Sinorhizobium terangae]WFU51259.1 IS110 family transposase [Sinorhizobium terangae]
MDQYIGLDVSLKDTAISIRQDGKRVWRGKCPSDPKALAQMISKHAPQAKRVVFETGPLSTWFYHALTAEGLPAICIEARHAQKVLNETLNKTDANDADGLAQLAEAGFYKAVRVKAFDSMLTRTLVAARNQLLSISKQLSNQIRGLMKTFGLIVPKGAGRVFDANVRGLLDGNAGLELVVLPLLEAWRDIRRHAANLDHQVLGAARESQATKLLMTIPGVGAVTAVSYIAAIEDPVNFRTSRSVGAWLGLTTRRYQSGEIDYDGHISRRGDGQLRGLLYEAATVLLTRTSRRAECSLKTWGLKLRERLGFRRAAVAVARKLAVIMHSMLKTGEVFNALAGDPA